jgi:hypothetical protein
MPPGRSIMAPAASSDPAAAPEPAPAGASTGGSESTVLTPVPVSREELNAWRRGFTPQAEIWNGRLAMLGLSVGLAVLLIARLAASHS